MGSRGALGLRTGWLGLLRRRGSLCRWRRGKASTSPAPRRLGRRGGRIFGRISGNRGCVSLVDGSEDVRTCVLSGDVEVVLGFEDQRPSQAMRPTSVSNTGSVDPSPVPQTSRSAPVRLVQ